MSVCEKVCLSYQNITNFGGDKVNAFLCATQSALAKTGTGVFQRSGYLGRLRAGAAGCAARGAWAVKQKDPRC